MDSKYGEGPTYARATPQFQGSEWFSTVVIRRGENDKEYGQLRVLFKCNVLTRGGQKITKELSLIKMYRFVQVDTFFDYPLLQWEEDHTRKYKVVEISTIEKAVQVIPHFGSEGHFFVNMFKF
jgi:hypothetical protein